MPVRQPRQPCPVSCQVNSGQARQKGRDSMGRKRVMDEAANRHYRAVMDSIPHAREAKHATPEERLLVVARIIDGLDGLIGLAARRARGAPRPASFLASAPRCQCATRAGAPCRMPAMRGQSWCRVHRPGGRRQAVSGTARHARPGHVLDPVERRLAAWLPANVAQVGAFGARRLDRARAWLDSQRQDNT